MRYLTLLVLFFTYTFISAQEYDWVMPVIQRINNYNEIKEWDCKGDDIEIRYYSIASIMQKVHPTTKEEMVMNSTYILRREQGKWKGTIIETFDRKEVDSTFDWKIFEAIFFQNYNRGLLVSPYEVKNIIPKSPDGSTFMICLKTSKDSKCHYYTSGLESYMEFGDSWLELKGVKAYMQKMENLINLFQTSF